MKTMKKTSLRAAINAKCKACIYDPASGQGAWRQQVEACTDRTCPLWEVRPMSATRVPAPAGRATKVEQEEAA